MKNVGTKGFKAVALMCILTFSLGLFMSILAPSRTMAEAPETEVTSEAAENSAEETAEIAATAGDVFEIGEGEDAISYDLTDADSALKYVGNYADNLSADLNFKAHVDTAIAKVREDIPAYATWLSLLAPIVAILLALITKEVYSSLVIGILVGGVIYAGVHVENILNHVLFDGFVANLADSYNMGILIFLVLLGAMVALMNKAGGSAAFGRWATAHIKTRVGAQLATIALGVLIFIDDYFNCLTVGSVMRPVTDGHNISRAKLAYLIDATAAPVCIIAPISSWAAAVAGFANAAGAKNGIALFIQAIPYNFYAILTIVMMLYLAFTNLDYGSMRRHEENAVEKGDIFTSGTRPAISEIECNEKGRVADLIFPIAVLIISCIIGMIYSGGFFSGENFVDAFSNSDASVGLVLGSFVAILLTMIYFLYRKVMSFKDMMACLPEGFQAMVPAILILSCAWTLKAMTDSLGAKIFVSQMVEGSAAGLQMLLPAIIFIIAIGLSFATGTSWGTFGILIPIVLSVFQSGEPITIVAVSACMAGAVCGDHCSPISDTTIMASAGAQCDHVNHVSTQLPYALTVAGVSAVSYMIAGAVCNWVIVLPIAIALQIGTLIVIRKILAARGA